MSCGKGKKRNGGQTREIVAGLFAADKPDQAARHRRTQCNHASECGSWCPDLVKGPGVGQAYCVDSDTGRKVALAAALKDPEFRCRRGLF